MIFFHDVFYFQLCKAGNFEYFPVNGRDRLVSCDEIEVEEFHDEKEPILIAVTPRPALPVGCSSLLALIAKPASLVSEPLPLLRNYVF